MEQFQRQFSGNTSNRNREFSRQQSATKSLSREKTEYLPATNLKVNFHTKLPDRLVYQIIDHNHDENLRTLKEFKRDGLLELPKYEMNSVNFSAYMSEECYTESSLIKMKFYIKNRKTEELLPVAIEYDINIEQQVNSEDKLFYLIQSNVRVPWTTSEQQSFELFYFYHMTKSLAEAQTAEYDLARNQMIRVYSSANGVKEHFDGVVFFGAEQSREDPLKNMALKSFLKLNELNNGLTPQCLTRMHTIFKCLCVQDKDYKRLFDLYVSHYAEQFLREIASNQGTVHSWHNKTLLAIFYCSFEFDVQQFQSMEFLNRLFGLYRPISIKEFVDYRSSDTNQKRCLTWSLPKYLRKLADENFRTLSGMSAYIVYYYMERLSLTDMLEFRLTSLERRDNQELLKYLQLYRPLFQEDSSLAALFLSYLPLSAEGLKDIINNGFVGFEAVIIFMKIYIDGKKIDRRFEQEFINLISFLSTDELIEKQIDEFKRSYSLLNNAVTLVNSTVVSAPKSIDLITMLITYILKLVIQLQKVLMLSVGLTSGGANQRMNFTMESNNNERRQQIEEVKILFKDKLLKSVSYWLKRECNESLLINFGLNERDIGVLKQYQEQEECLREIHEIRLWTLHDTKTRIDSDMTFRVGKIIRYMQAPTDLQMFQTPQSIVEQNGGLENFLNKTEHEILKAKITLGTNKEDSLYTALLSIGKKLQRSFSASGIKWDTDMIMEFNRHILDQFKERMADRCFKDFKEIVQFRNRFGFEQRFGDYCTSFRGLVDDKISERLASKGIANDLGILCENLKGNFSLLQYYTDKLLMTKFPGDSILDLDKLLAWESYLRLIELAIKAGPDTVLSTKWWTMYEKSFRNLAVNICGIIKAEKDLRVIKLVYNNIKVVEKIAQFIVTQTPALQAEKIHPVYSVKSIHLLPEFLKIRHQEVLEFEAYKVDMKVFIQYCSKFPQIQINQHAKELAVLESAGTKIEAYVLDKVCQTFNYTTDKTSLPGSKYMPSITYFSGITKELMQTIRQIIRFDRSKSVLFDYFFNISCDKVLEQRSKSSLEITESIVLLWDLTIRQLCTITQPIDTGAIKLTKLDSILVKFFGGNFQKMKAEVDYLLDQSYLEVENVDMRKSQIALWDRFKSSHETAKTIEDIRTKLNLEQKFTQLNDLLAISSDIYMEWTLLKMDTELAKIVKVLDNINSLDKLACLKSYVESIELVDWLRQNTKDINELKVLVDLISESESGKDATLAKTLLDACKAYNKLIYDFQVNDGFFRFIELAEIVCSFLSSDKNIASKLKYVSDKVPMLDKVQKSQGNVMSSLKKAKRINDFGVYKISPVVRSVSNSLDEIEATGGARLEELITLELTGDVPMEEMSSMESTSEKRMYTYEELKDLQSILMLFVPRQEQKNDIESEAVLETFIETFNGVVRLVELYLKLDEHGCSFFKQFKVNIYNATDAEMMRISRMYLDKSDSPVEIRSVDPIRSLSEFMRQCLQSWSSFTSNLRDNYHGLNYFTTNQIQFLNQFISNTIHKPQKSNTRLDQANLNYASAILSTICPNISTDIVRTVHKETLNTICPSSSGPELNQSEIATDNKTLDSTWSQFIVKESSVNNQSVTLRHLATILNTLRDQNIRPAQRKVPGYLNKGEPSLITCLSIDQIATVLSMYAYDIHAPLPGSNEVLFCDTNTTYEELEIFLRRAFNSDSNTIHTALNCQALNYETSNLLELNYQKLAKSSSREFLLVFVCCQSRQRTDSIVESLFANNKISPVNLSPQDIKQYLNQNLINRAFMKEQNEKKSVRILLSERSGNGKSTHVLKFNNKLEASGVRYRQATIRIKDTILNMDSEVFKLLKKIGNETANDVPTVYHIDIAQEVYKNVDQYLFNLVVCGQLRHRSGYVFCRNMSRDVYFIEMTQTVDRRHSMVELLPQINFRTPAKYLYDLQNRVDEDEPMDNMEYERAVDTHFESCFRDIKYQRGCYYLKIIREILVNRQSITDQEDILRTDDELLEINFDADKHRYSETETLSTFLKLSKLNDPNWLELTNFANFLDIQLGLCEQAVFLKELKCLRSICIQLLVIMANDFGLPSLNTQELRTQGNANALDRQFSVGPDINLDALSIVEARRWENMLHPYIIFNADRNSITFLGTFISRKERKFMNPNTDTVIENMDPAIPKLSSEAFLELLKNRVRIFDNFNGMIHESKMQNLCNVMGLKYNSSMDRRSPMVENYELTLDNCLKMMAIYLRFKANNPVIIMGETGCGKTSLIDFFSFLNLRGPWQDRNLVHVKIHGGTTARMLETRLAEAEALSKFNYSLFKGYGLIREESDDLITAVLFFDEANTTESIGLIKEIMCDFTCNGRPVNMKHGLKIVAAVNPYKKHSQEMINKLEQAGLGFFVTADETKEKLGHIPMRQLVYRVQPLPSSLLPIVWDFGRLEENIERTYINQMLEKAASNQRLPSFCKEASMDTACKMSEHELEYKFILDLINISQNFMRQKKDECSFVSIRDVERVIKVTSWFLKKRDLIFTPMANRKMDGFDTSYRSELSDLRRACVLALAVCYYSRLVSSENRQQYRDVITRRFSEEASTKKWPANWMLCEILTCQNIFMDEINLQTNIARNSALLENVFMMIICIELRIPLFIVGKPGSSKSLAKSIVSSAMRGRNNDSTFFQNLKETYFVNFQCSPLTTSDKILTAFERAAKFQVGSDLETSVAVVNLDEIGLAEGSESMPLKSLHTLLEEGVPEQGEHGKVSVIGISNWALDPAKMNRGLFVSRGEPDIEELVVSAEGICNYDQTIFACIKPFIKEIALAYLDLCETARNFKREFFGLRDYYSLIKMLYSFCSRDKHLTWLKLEHAIKRNFNGLAIDIMAPFEKYLRSKLGNTRLDTDPKCNPIDLIESALRNDLALGESISRYLLFLSENSAAIDIIQSFLINVVKVPVNSLSIIFGSSFRNDQQYSEICRNISLIKHSMEIGNTVILLNSYNLYESLYDALNQYYYELAGQKFVDLGLGTHSVKASIHDNFRLIVIADKEAVYDAKKFPIPLINRLEKHFLTAANMLSEKQLEIRDQLDLWIKKIVRASMEFVTLKPAEIFIGYHEDTTSSLVLHLSEQFSETELLNPSNVMDTSEVSSSAADLSMDSMALDGGEQKKPVVPSDVILLEAKRILLRCATPDSVIRAHKKLQEAEEKEFLWNEYFINQKHLSLAELLHFHIKPANLLACKSTTRNLIQVTTNSNLTLLNSESKLNLANSLATSNQTLEFCILKTFDTMLQFSSRIKQFLTLDKEEHKTTSNGKRYLFIQADQSQEYGSDMIACARHTIVESFKEILTSKHAENLFIVLLINLPKENVEKFVGFQFSHWSCYHLDEIEDNPPDLPAFERMNNTILSRLLTDSLKDSDQLENSMDVDSIGQNGAGRQNLEMGFLLKKLAHNACSLITDVNLARTINRIDVFIQLCDDAEFVGVLGKRLAELQKDKEEYIGGGITQGANWLSKDVASTKTINLYSTFRRSCQHYFESRLSPILAYLLSFIDQYSNLETLASCLKSSTPFDKWKHQLWLDILADNEISCIEYSGMRNDNVESSRFKCQSDLLLRKSISEFYDAEIRSLRPSLPFSWIIIDQLTSLHKSFIDGTKQQTKDYTAYISSVSQFFQGSRIFKMFTNSIAEIEASLKDSRVQFLETIIVSYINDFVLKNCAINSRRDLESIANIIKVRIQMFEGSHERVYELKWALPMVHYLYYGIRNEIDMYLKFTAFDKTLNETAFLKPKEMFDKTGALQLSLKSCTECIRLFKQELAGTFTEATARTRLCHLIKLITEVLGSAITQAQSECLYGQYESLNLLLIFIDNFILLSKQNEHMGSFLNQVIVQINTEHFNENVDFLTAQTVQKLHNLIVSMPAALEATLAGKSGAFEVTDLVERLNETLNVFYVNVVEFLVFDKSSENQRVPMDDTVELILQAITSDQLQFDAGRFKIKPIYRSLLIRIVYRSLSDKVITHLKKWYNNTENGKPQQFQAAEELALLFLDCVYDEAIQKISSYNTADQILEATRVCDEIKKLPASERVFKEKKTFMKTYNVDFLQVLAKIKFCLFTMAKLVHSRELIGELQGQAGFQAFNTKLKELLESHFKFVGTNEILVNYLIKELIRSYGSASVTGIMGNSQLNWMTPKHLIGDDEHAVDKYVIEPRYVLFKDAIVKSFKEKKSTVIEEIVADCQFDFHPYLLMALYQNVTILYRNVGNITTQILDIFEPIKAKYFDEKPHLTKALFLNSFTHNIRVSKENWQHIDLSALLIQIKFTVLYSNCYLIGALKELLEAPGGTDKQLAIAQKYLPTMNQDTLYDVKKALTDGSSTQFYICPNGHQYAIGDCGRPWIKAACPECGSIIGGTNHSLEQKNKLMTSDYVDQTKTGYLLQEASKQPDQPRTIRHLNDIGTQVVRFFLHACLYLACGDEDEHRNSMLSAIIEANPTDVKEFFWQHMLLDLKITCKILNITTDELIILFHKICFNFVKSKSQNQMQENIASFSSKGERQQWEHSFYKTYLAPTFKAVSDNVSSVNNAIKKYLEKDDSNQSRIYFMAYELTADPNSEFLYEMEKFWRFRPLISFNFMAQELKNTTKSEHFKILKQFAHLIDHLELTFHLPSIMRLLNLLKSQLNKRVSKYKSQNMSVRQFFESAQFSDGWTIQKAEKILERFQFVWSAIKDEIDRYIVSSISPNSFLTTKPTGQEFNLDSKLSYFLPTLNGDGLYSYALIHWLASIQNDMLSFYINLKKEKSEDRRSIEEFQEKEFIIKFGKQTDLLGLVQGNFSYDSRELKCLFQYKNIENRLIDRYLRRKPMVNTENMPLFEYSDVIYDANIFERLEGGNKQELLDINVQTNLFGDYEQINDVSEELNILKIVINYASTTAIDSSTTIASFINKIYPSSGCTGGQKVLKSKTVEACELKHLKHIWLLLNVRRSMLYTISGQDPFEMLRDTYKEEKTFRLRVGLDPGLVVSVLSVIYQLVTSCLNTTDDDLQGSEDKKICDYFQYLDSLDVMVSDNVEKVATGSFPDENTKMSCIFALWKYVCAPKS